MKRTKQKSKPKPKRDYSKLGRYKVNFEHNLDMEHTYVYLSKEIVRELQNASLAVYVALACKATDQTKPLRISYEALAQLTGNSDKTVKKGVKQLEEMDVFKREKVSRGGINQYEYSDIQFYQKGDIKVGIEEKDLFQFYKSLVYNGIWSKMTSEDKNVYIALRFLAKTYPHLYMHYEHGDEFDEDVPEGWDHQLFFSDYYSDRKWDIVQETNLSNEIHNRTGLNSERMVTCFENLDRLRLFEPADEDNPEIFYGDYDHWYKVYLSVTYKDFLGMYKDDEVLRDAEVRGSIL